MIDPFAQLQQAQFEGLALSLYLPAGPALDQAFHHALLKDLERDWTKVLTREKRLALEREIRRVGAFLDQRSAGGRPLAIFSSEPADLLEIYRLPSDVTAELRIDRRLYLDPLVSMLGVLPLLIVAVDKERGRVFTSILDRVQQVAELRGEPIKHQRQGGWSQEKYQRREDLRAEGNARAVVDWIVRHRETYPGPIVVVGPPKARATFIQQLPDPLHAALLGEFAAPLYATSGALTEQLRGT
ncbi:MAG TPA: Vms1/Ankzf1 family peptidyl-tRNA hydrolase [Candidatus Limnocylindrales bacterium]|nr:Vms1/Ankzf1 family peptidyl-tRNA hydrolase [Candidatus Limnocylindrales bacterium]